MTRLLVTGPAGSGKTRLVLERFAAALGEVGPERARLILPTASQVRHATGRLLREEEGFGVRGFAGAPIGTFDDLAAGALGPDAARSGALPAEVRLAYVAEALDAEPWGGDAALSARPGFRRALSLAVAQAKENVQPSEEIAAALEGVGGGRERGLAAALRAYEAVRLRRGGRDRSDVQREAIAAIRADAARLGGAERVFLDGFHNFTPLQFELLILLLERAESVTLTLAYDDDRPELFAEAHRTLGFLSTHWTWERLPLGDAPRFEAEGLRALESSFFTPPAVRSAPTAPVKDPPALFVAPSARAECEEIARRVVLLAKGGVPYERIGVLLRAGDARGGALGRAFDARGVPFRRSEPAPLAASPLARALTALLRLLLGRWRREDLAEALGSPYLRAPVSAPPLPKAAMTPEGWVDWARRKKHGDFAERLEALRAAMPRPLSAEGVERALDALVALDAPEGADARLLAEEAAAYEAWRALWRRVFAGPGGALGGDLRRAARLFEEALDEATFTPRDRRRAVVQILDLREARGWELDHVFLPGLADGAYPAPRPASPFVGQAAIRALEARGVFLPDPERLAREEAHLAYVALTRARAGLTLSYARETGEGREAGPSPYLEDAAEALGFAGVEDWAERTKAPREAEDAAALRREALRPSAPPGLREALAERDAPFALALRVGEAASADEARHVPIAEPAFAAWCAERYGESPFSARRLRTHAECAYKFFARYTLALDADAAEETEDATVQGSLAHALLEALAEDPEADLDALAGPAAERALGRPPGSARERETVRRVTEDVRRFRAERAEWFGGPWRSVGAEASFEELNEGGPFVLSEAAPPVRLSGRFDRVDLLEEGGRRAVRAIDYKYGTKGLDDGDLKKEVLEGIDPQLPLYLIVAAERLGATPAGAFRAAVRSGLVTGVYPEKERGALAIPDDAKNLKIGRDPIAPDAEAMAAFLADARAGILARAGRIRAGDMARLPWNEKNCKDRCDFRSLCRIRLERGEEEGGGEGEDA